MKKFITTERTKAIERYARKHGFYASTVRKMTSLRLAAITEWMAANRSDASAGAFETEIRDHFRKEV